jgi:hypothetical protein
MPLALDRRDIKENPTFLLECSGQWITIDEEL